MGRESSCSDWGSTVFTSKSDRTWRAIDMAGTYRCASLSMCAGRGLEVAPGLLQALAHGGAEQVRIEGVLLDLVHLLDHLGVEPGADLGRRRGKARADALAEGLELARRDVALPVRDGVVVVEGAVDAGGELGDEPRIVEARA